MTLIAVKKNTPKTDNAVQKFALYIILLLTKHPNESLKLHYTTFKKY